MACDETFASVVRKRMNLGQCEVNMHLHAWNSSPIQNLNKRTDSVEDGLPYITEHTVDIIEEKVKFQSNLLIEKYNIQPVHIEHVVGQQLKGNTHIF